MSQDNGRDRTKRLLPLLLLSLGLLAFLNGAGWTATSQADGLFSFDAASAVDLEHLVGTGARSLAGQEAIAAENGVRWGLRKIQAPQAWELTRGSDRIVVAVIDSGIDRSHSELRGNLWVNEGEVAGNGLDDDGNGYVDDLHGWDFRDGDADSLRGSPIHPHGTFVAGLIAALADSTGIGGVAPQVRVMDLRFLDSSNRFYDDDWDEFVAAVNYAADNGADIINLSIFARYRPPREFHQALKRALDHGVTIVGVAGNAAAQVQYPGKYEEVIAVSAIDENESLAYFSNMGPEVELAAPGTNVRSLNLGGGYTVGSGTSFAGAHVAGAVALLLSVQSDLTPAGARQVLRETARDLGPDGKDDEFGYGLIDAAAVVNSLLRSPADL